MPIQPFVNKYNSEKEYYIDEGCYITELSNSEDDPGLSIARARVVPGETTQLHQLQGVIERYVILEGEGIVEIGDKPPQKVTQCDVVIIPSNCPQKISNTGSTDLLFLAICSPRFKPDNYLTL
jgi:mannose-6-phosphate isomerase-like protein (cupin superfamily)